MERLEILGTVIADKRKDAVAARKESGIEEVWLAAEEAYLGIDDMNRGEFKAANWAKPTTMHGGLTTRGVATDPTRSSAFVRLTSRYVDNASAKLGEILFPIDDKAFSFDATPVPELIEAAKDTRPMMGQFGQPLMRPMKDEEVQAQAQQGAVPQMPAMTPTAAGAQQMVQKTVADHAQEQMEAARDCAKKAETRIYDWMVEAKYPAEGRKIVHDAARLGVGVLKGPFPDIQESRALTRDGKTVKIEMVQKVVPSLKWVDPWNLFPHDGCGENIHDGDGLLERDFLAPKMLKRLKKQEGYLADQIDQVLEEGPGKCYVEGGNPNDKQHTRKRFEIWYYYGTLTREEMALANAVGIEDLPEDQDEVHAIVSLVNDTVIRAVINPLDSGKFPYHVMTWSRRPGHWAGVGVGEQMAMPQRAVNAATRALFNNAGVASGVQIILNQTAVVPADQRWTITPNKVWYLTGDVDDVRKAFGVFVIPSMQADLSAIIEYGMKLAEESTGIPLITQGQTGPSSPETFGQAELQDNNAHTWLRSVGYRYDDQITEPTIDCCYEWLLLDPSVPNEEKGDFKINAHGSIAMVERAIQEQTLMGLLSASANPAFALDPPKLMALYLKAKRLDPREAQFSKEEQESRAKAPPPPPVQVAVEQIKGQNQVKAITTKAQADATLAQQEVMHGQPAEAAKAEQARIDAASRERVEASRSHAEMARADRELLIAQQNGDRELAMKEIDRDLAVLAYAKEHSMQLVDVKRDLGKTAMQERTKRELAAAEIQLATNQGHEDRALDLHKHHNPSPSLVKDEVSTPTTP
jgi:hypothetical protein